MSKAGGRLGRFRGSTGHAFPAGAGLAQESLGEPALSVVAAARLDDADSDDERLSC